MRLTISRRERPDGPAETDSAGSSAAIYSDGYLVAILGLLIAVAGLGVDVAWHRFVLTEHHEEVVALSNPGHIMIGLGGAVTLIGAVLGLERTHRLIALAALALIPAGVIGAGLWEKVDPPADSASGSSQTAAAPISRVAAGQGADMRGEIRAVAFAEGGGAAGTLLVERANGDNSGYAKAAVRVEEGTTVLHRQGDAVHSSSFYALAVGQQVEVRFKGPIAESDPVLATAAEVVIIAAPD